MNLKFNLSWDFYNNHLQRIMKDLLDTGEKSDVTLVCNEQSKIKAHKFVLKSVSAVFQRIFENEDESNVNSYVYLKGIDKSDMKAVLEFLYNGEVTIQQERINEFMKTAKDLEIKKIQDLTKDGDLEGAKSDEYMNYEENSDEKSNVKNGSYSLSNKNTSMYQCSQCDSKFKFKGDRKKHLRSKHEGIRYPCHICAYQATIPQDLKKHINIHEGVNYPCNYCEYKANRKDNLKVHIDKKHYK